MNVLKEIKIPKIFKSIKQSQRTCSTSNGTIDKVSSTFFNYGEQPLRYINKFDKGNAKQLTEIKLIYKHGSGYYSLMPFLYRSYAKLINAIELHMNSIGGQRILLPSIYSIELLQESERFDILKNELFMLNGRNNKELYLAPTHEEPVTSIVSSVSVNHKKLPILLYQIDSKFRNELRPRFGLLRSNQFVMKDLYSFDKDQESAFKTYEKVCQSYVDLFNYLELDFIKVFASNGLMGGKFSHEFHLISKYGEDNIYLCNKCKTAYNKETLLDQSIIDSQVDKSKNNESKFCPECNEQMNHQNSIEIGHTFYLGTKYSEKMNASFLDQMNQKKSSLEMCCFGIGVTRILSAFISQQTNSLEINWPLKIAPYHVLVIPPKHKSKENIDQIGSLMAESISNVLKSKGFDVLIDDRDITIGRRLIDCKAYGFPFKIIIGKDSINEIPKFEFKSKDENLNLTHTELIDKFDMIRQNFKINHIE